MKITQFLRAQVHKLFIKSNYMYNENVNMIGCKLKESPIETYWLKYTHSVVPRSRFLGDTGVPLPEFQRDIYKFWGTHQIFQNFTC